MEQPEAPQDPAGGRGWDRRRTIGAVVGGVVVAGILALLIVGLLNRDLGTSIQSALDEGKRPDAPDFSLPVLRAGDDLGPPGTEVSLESLRGRTVVLNFWASWCEPCKDETPVLNRVAERYRKQGRNVVVVGVDVQDLRENALDFARSTGVAYPLLRDGTDNAMRAFEVPRLPESFVIDPSGRIALHVIGQVVDPAQITTAVDQL
jgi:cytochrome c biogenesis protein CcmG, thiol:disulfide interchange protein DsbE